MARRNDCLLDISCSLDAAGDTAKPLFEGCVAAFSTTAGQPNYGAGDPEFFPICRPDDALALDSGWAFAGIIDVGGFTGHPLFNLSAGTTNFPLPQDQSAKLQLLGLAKAKGLPSTTFSIGEDVGYLPAHGGYVVPIRLYPGAYPLGKSRSSLTTGTSDSNLQKSSSFITLELQPAALGKSDRLIGSWLADSATQTGSSEVAFGTDGGATPSADVAQVRVYGNQLKQYSLLTVEAQVKFTGVNAGDTAIVRLRYGGLTGALLATTGPTKAFAANDVATLRAVLAVNNNTAGRLIHSQGMIGTPAGIVAQVSGGSASVTLPNINADRNVVTTVQFNSANAANLAIQESLSVRYIR